MKQQQSSLRLIPTRYSYLFTVALKLTYETRYIGKLDKTGEGTFISNKRTEEHIFQKSRALGINRQLCESLKFRWIVVPYCGRELWTSRIFILQNGQTFTFRKAGFESQFFLGLDKWTLDKAMVPDVGIQKQGDLFSEEAA